MVDDQVNNVIIDSFTTLKCQQQLQKQVFKEIYEDFMY